MGYRKYCTLLSAGLLALSLSAPAFSQDNQGGTLSADEATRELANPNTSLASLTFRNQVRTYNGDLPDADEQSGYTMLFQPVFPLVLGTTAEGVSHKLFVRPAIPLQLGQPTFNGTFNDASGLGDIGFDIAYGLSYANGFQIAAGVAGSLPTATGQVPGGNTSLGPEIFTGFAGDFGFAGALLNHQWSIDDWSDSRVNRTTLQPILTFVLPDGWAVGSIPIMSYDYVNDEATVPLNAYIQKTVNIGNTPTRFLLEANYYPDGWRPDAIGPEWFIGLNVTPVVKNVFQALID